MDKQINLAPNPKHVAIIMDGNGRWAEARNRRRIIGHYVGANRVREIVKCCPDLSIKYLTIFAFSTENWNRLQSETRAIFKLMERFLSSEVSELNDSNVKFNVVGSFRKDQKRIAELVDYAEKLTQYNTGLKLNVAINYGGKSDIISAARNVALSFKKNEISLSEIDENFFYSNLLSKNVSNIDLLIRTSGEQRISNFMLWQLSYSEIYFSDILWPDFDKNEFRKALECYSKRNRRFGSSSKAS